MTPAEAAAKYSRHDPHTDGIRNELDALEKALLAAGLKSPAAAIMAITMVFERTVVDLRVRNADLESRLDALQRELNARDDAAVERGE